MHGALARSRAARWPRARDAERRQLVGQLPVAVPSLHVARGRLGCTRPLPCFMPAVAAAAPRGAGPAAKAAPRSARSDAPARCAAAMRFAHPSSPLPPPVHPSPHTGRSEEARVAQKAPCPRPRLRGAAGRDMRRGRALGGAVTSAHRLPRARAGACHLFVWQTTEAAAPASCISQGLPGRAALRLAGWLAMRAGAWGYSLPGAGCTCGCGRGGGARTARDGRWLQPVARACSRIKWAARRRRRPLARGPSQGCRSAAVGGGAATGVGSAGRLFK